MTPALKANLRRKNRLMHRGRVEEAGALAKHIGKDISVRNKTYLSRINGKTGVKDVWTDVRKLTGRKQ